MPKKTEPKLTERRDGRAVVHWKGKMHIMGKSGTPEAKTHTSGLFHRVGRNRLDDGGEYDHRQRLRLW